VELVLVWGLWVAGGGFGWGGWGGGLAGGGLGGCGGFFGVVLFVWWFVFFLFGGWLWFWGRCFLRLVWVLGVFWWGWVGECGWVGWCFGGGLGGVFAVGGGERGGIKKEGSLSRFAPERLRKSLPNTEKMVRKSKNVCLRGS